MEYRQLTQTQRYQILALHSTGLSMREVGKIVGCHNSSVSRELRRNLATDAHYKPEEAQALSDTRRRSALKANKRNAGVIMWIVQRQLSCPVQRQLTWPVDAELKLSVS